MSRRSFLVPPAKGPLANLPATELEVLDATLGSVDSLNEADRGGNHAGRDVLATGQAAVNTLKALRGRS